MTVPFVVAELSANHNGSLDRALKTVEAVAKAGANAIKLQTFTPDCMTLDLDLPHFYVSDPMSPWFGRRLYDLYKEAMTPWEWHEKIFQCAKDNGIEGFSTPFSVAAVDFLESLNVPRYKIASFENTDPTILTYVASKKKPVILSTGGITPLFAVDSIDLLRKNGATDITVLKCLSVYPAPPDTCRMAELPTLRNYLKCPIGLSDHTVGPWAALAGTVLGMSMLEKHVTLSRADGGLDAGFSMEPAELRRMIQNMRRIAEVTGSDSEFICSPEAVKAMQPAASFRRSLFFVRDLAKGSTIKADDVKSLRPAVGLEPQQVKNVVGRVLAKDVAVGEPVTHSTYEC